jgi:hypothetical protein
MENKKIWWTSKTVWLNVLALIGSLAVAYGLEESRWAEISAVSLAVINLILRLVTKDEIVLKSDDSAPTSDAGTISR